MRLIALLLLALAAGLLHVPAAQAQACSFSIANVNFGNINMGPGGTPPTSSTLTATCTGQPNRTITICPNIGDGTAGSVSGNPRLLANGPNTIGFNLLQSNGQVWGSYVWPYPSRPPVFSLTLNSAGSATMTQTIQAVISGSIASAVPGTYTSIYGSYHTLIDYGYAPAQSCSTVSPRATQAPFSVQATTVAACNISTTPLDFGTVADLTTSQAATGQIGITCTRGANYSVSLGNGLNGGSGAANRKLSSPAAPGSLITYGIFRDAAHTQPWGQTAGSDTASGTGTGTQQTLTTFGFLPAQPAAAPASYSDVIVVTVSY